jgi:hypothetical protein
LNAAAEHRVPRRWHGRRGALALALVATLVLAAPAAARAGVMYWGGTIKGDVYGVPGEAPTSAAVLGEFEAHAGKQITFVNTGQSWASFNATTMNAAIAIGAIPLVTMPLDGATLEDVVDGKEDTAIRNWAKAAKEFGYPFLFRPWWEPNGDWYTWGRNPDYVAAWRHFHDLVEEVGATNVTWDWVVNAIWSDPISDPTPYYPGAAYVDWVGMDAYNWGENPLQSDRWLTAEESIQPTLDLLEDLAPGKPVCICESASTEYGNGGPSENKALWIHEMLAEYLPSRPAIKAYLWFNWNHEQESSGERFDWPIESSPQAQAAFRAGIQGETFLSVLPPLTKLAKVPMPAWPPPPADPPAPPAPSGPAAGPATDPSSTGRGKQESEKQPGAAAIAFGAARANSRSGTAKLPITLPGPGTLRFSGGGVRVRVLPSPHFARTPFSKWAGSAGRLVLEVAAAGRTRAALRASGAADVALTVRYSPLDGKARRATARLTLSGG